MMSPCKQKHLVEGEEGSEKENISLILHSDPVPCDLEERSRCIDEESFEITGTSNESSIYEFSPISPAGGSPNTATDYCGAEGTSSLLLPSLSMVIKRQITHSDRRTDVTKPIDGTDTNHPATNSTTQTSLCNASTNKEYSNESNNPHICTTSLSTAMSDDSTITTRTTVGKSPIHSFTLGDVQHKTVESYVEAIKHFILEEGNRSLSNSQLQTDDCLESSQSLINIILPKKHNGIDLQLTNSNTMKITLQSLDMESDNDNISTATVPLLNTAEVVAAVKSQCTLEDDTPDSVALKPGIGGNVAHVERQVLPDTHEKVQVASDEFLVWFNAKNDALGGNGVLSLTLEVLTECDTNAQLVDRTGIMEYNTNRTLAVIHPTDRSDELLLSNVLCSNVDRSETGMETETMELPVNSPLLFFDNEDTENYPDILMAPKSCQETARGMEKRRLKQIQESLIGVIPPPSITIPQLGVDEILRLFKQNDELMARNLNTEKIHEVISTNLLHQAMESHWPEVTTCGYHDVHFNNGAMSEEFEALSQKFIQRFVGCETASSCNVWAASDSGAKSRNCKRAVGHSPGRRLSHLARRRRAFSRDNLLSNLPARTQQSSAAERRQIMVQNKKPGNPQIGKFPNKALTHKRALFQSPDDLRKKLPTAKSGSSSKRKVRSCKPAAGGQSFKRALFSSATKDKDRASVVRSQTSSSKRKLTFPATEVPSTSDRPSSSASGKASSLSSGQKKKLLWAVAEALRGHGIGLTHSLFRPCAAALARLCRFQLPSLLSKRGGSTTTELLVELANRHVTNIIKEKLAEEAT